MGWIIASAALVLLVLLFFIRVFVRIDYGNELAVYLNILFLKIKVFPTKPKKKDKKKPQEKEKKKKTKKEIKTEEKEKEPEKKKTVKEILDLVKSVYDISKKIISMFFGYLSVRVYKLLIVIDGGEASKTALEYAGVTAAVNALFALLDENVDVKYGKAENIDVRPEFTQNGSSAEIDISFGLRLWQLIRLGINALMAYLKIKSKTEGTDK